MDQLGNTSEMFTSAPRSRIWAIASGKGGVGKTFITASLGITLSKLGKSVIIVDLDLSGANIHTALGIEPAKTNIRHFFEGTRTLQECVSATPYPHLSYVQGFWDSWTPCDFSLEQIHSLNMALKKLHADYILVDLSAGGLHSHLEIFKNANERLLVTSPEPTSIEKTYRFIENYISYSLKESSQPQAYEILIKTLRDHRQKVLGKPFSFRKYLSENTGVSFDIFSSLTQNPLRLIVNGSRSQENIDLGYSIKSVCNKYFDLSLDYTGTIDFDNAVWQSFRSREPVLIAQPFTPLAGQFLTICKHLIDPHELRAII